MKKVLSVITVLAVLLLTLSSCNSGGLKGKHHVEIKIKNYEGVVKVELDGDAAPLTVENFVNLCQKGFYNGLTFHRLDMGFVLQGGDPNGDGTGGCESSIKGEFNANGVKNNIKHKTGVISMARNQFNYDSASSQFFICLGTCGELDGEYAAFGKITDGMDIITKVCEDIVSSNGGEKVLNCISKEKQPVIESITVID